MVLIKTRIPFTEGNGTDLRRELEEFMKRRESKLDNYHGTLNVKTNGGTYFELAETFPYNIELFGGGVKPTLDDLNQFREAIRGAYKIESTTEVTV